MPSVAQLGLNTQPFERDNSLACKPCRVGQILRAGQPHLLPATGPGLALGCWHSFQGWVVSEDGDRPIFGIELPVWLLQLQPKSPTFAARTKLSNLMLPTVHSRVHRASRPRVPSNGTGPHISSGALQTPTKRWRLGEDTSTGTYPKSAIKFKVPIAVNYPDDVTSVTSVKMV